MADKFQGTSRKENAEMRTATYRNIQVEVLVEYESSNLKYAGIRAIEGKPFHTKDKWLSMTEYATVKANELIGYQSNGVNGSEKPTILEMALSYSDKKQWYSGESVWLWQDGNKGVFLKEQDGFVALNITGYREYLNVFWLNPETWSWEPTRNLGANYFLWMEKYRESSR